MPSLTANLVDVANRVIYGATIEYTTHIQRITPTHQTHPTYVLPGFVDAHVHVESSMLPPREFARLASIHGTVATVSDPHEIANVLGLPGVRYMIEQARRAPIPICFGAPSCVPATTFETAGARLDAAAVRELLELPEIGYLAEVMNFPGVLSGEPDLLRKLAHAKSLNKPIDGHAPGLVSPAARDYFAAGISTDHECFTLEEALDKLACAPHVKILIREGSAARNFDALHPLLDTHPDRVMFCTDDKHPNELVEGHINTLVARAVSLGIPLFNALQAACLNPLLHYPLPGALLREGDPATFIETADLTGFQVLRTTVNGTTVAERGASLLPHEPAPTPNRFEAAPITPADIAAPHDDRPVSVIGALDGQLITRHLHLPADAPDVLKLVVLNRYAPNAKPAIAHIEGFGLTRGAIASSVAHDSHNLIAVGADDASLARALNLLVHHKGGLSLVDPAPDASPSELILPLPIAGLMSDRPGHEVARLYTQLDAACKSLGSPLRSPYMTLSFMALLVIPHLKLSDKGLFDADRFQLF